MSDAWRVRLLAAIKTDGRSDRAISLAAGLGPNFIGQMRGTATSAPKNPSIENVAALALALKIPLASIIVEAEDQLRAALLAFGVHPEDIGRAVSAVKVFVDDPDEQSSLRPRRDLSAPANGRHAKAP